MEAIHEELRRRREERGLSLEDLSRETNINVRYLKAIEEGDFSVLPRAYIRMFLKAYGLRVGMDAESVLRRFDEMAAPEEEPIRKPIGQPIVRSAFPKKPLVIAGVVFAVVVGILIVLIGTRERPAPRPPGLLEASPEAALEHSISDTSDMEQSVEDEVGESDSVHVIEEAPAEAFTSFPEPSEEIEKPVAADSILVLEGEAREEVWLSVQSDGGSKEQRIMKAGERQRWEAKDRFEVTLGKPRGIALVFRGKAVDNTAWNRAPIHLMFSREGVQVVEKKRPPSETPASVDSVDAMNNEQ